MKPQFYLLGAAVAVLSLGACSKDEARPEPSNEGYAFSFTVAEDDTRTTLATSDILRWVYTDRVGIYTVGENLNPNTLTVADVNQSPVEFIGVLKRPVTPGDRFYAYYPYDPAQAADPAAVTLSIPVAQKQSKADVYNGESNPLVALPMEFPGVLDSYACRMSSVRFKQLGAIIELQLYASDEAIRSEAIRSITFEADAPLAGEFPFDLTAVTTKGELTISGYESTVASTVLEEPAAIPSSRDHAARVYLTIAPGEYAGAIVVKTDRAHYTFRLSAPLDFQRAVIKGMPADLARAERVESIPKNQIWYTTMDEKIVPVEAGLLIESNVYANGIGIITFKDSISEVPSHLFGMIGEEMRITSIRLPDGIIKIGDFAFFRCENLVDISLPESVTEIGYAAFGLCSGLQSVYIPVSVTTIGGSAFGYCTGLKRFEGPYASDDHRCLVIDGSLYGFAPADLFPDIPGNEFAYAIDVDVIEEGAFHGLNNIKRIVITGVKRIARNAFVNCSELVALHTWNKTIEVGDSAFENCTSFIGFQDALYRNTPIQATKIGTMAFRNCAALTEIVISETIEAIGDAAFQDCDNLTDIYCKRITVPSLGNEVFDEMRSVIHVPTASVEAYKTASGWSQYADRIVGYDLETL